jgi:hypothetical protein
MAIRMESELKTGIPYTKEAASNDSLFVLGGITF